MILPTKPMKEIYGRFMNSIVTNTALKFISTHFEITYKCNQYKCKYRRLNRLRYRHSNACSLTRKLQDAVKIIQQHNTATISINETLLDDKNNDFKVNTPVFALYSNHRCRRGRRVVFYVREMFHTLLTPGELFLYTCRPRHMGLCEVVNSWRAYPWRPICIVIWVRN